MKEIIVRVVVGGGVVTLFSMIGTVLKPKSFAGLFGAAPSVALATLFLTVAKEGTSYVALEARSMILGAIAFSVYAFVVSRTLMHRKLSVLPTAAVAMALWFGCAFGLCYTVLR